MCNSAVHCDDIPFIRKTLVVCVLVVALLELFFFSIKLFNESLKNESALEF